MPKECHYVITKSFIFSGKGTFTVMNWSLWLACHWCSDKGQQTLTLYCIFGQEHSWTCSFDDKELPGVYKLILVNIYSTEYDKVLLANIRAHRYAGCVNIRITIGRSFVFSFCLLIQWILKYVLQFELIELLKILCDYKYQFYCFFLLVIFLYPPSYLYGWIKTGS